MALARPAQNSSDFKTSAFCKISLCQLISVKSLNEGYKEQEYQLSNDGTVNIVLSGKGTIKLARISLSASTLGGLRDYAGILNNYYSLFPEGSFGNCALALDAMQSALARAGAHTTTSTKLTRSKTCTVGKNPQPGPTQYFMSASVRP